MSHTVRKHLVIIDGYHFLFRAYHGVRMLNRPSDGLPTNALYGFAQMLWKVLTDLQPDLMTVALDAPGGSFRNTLYPAYKANRSAMDEEMAQQLPHFQPLIEAFGVQPLKAEGYEADDIIATLVKRYEETHRITVISSDKDLMQLINDHVILHDTMRDKRFDAEAVQEKNGVPPQQMRDFLALVGDSSDNIPGVPGIGAKTAAAILAEAPSVESLLANPSQLSKPKWSEKIVEHTDTLKQALELVTLASDVPLSDTSLETHLDIPTAQSFLRELSFETLAKRLEKLKTEKAVQDDAPPQGEVHTLETVVVPHETFTHETLWTAEALAEWMKGAEVLAIDTETTGLNALTADLVGISLAKASDKGGVVGAYVPLGHEQDVFAETSQPSRDDILPIIRELLDNPRIRKVGHNVKYDGHILTRAIEVLNTPSESVYSADDFDDKTMRGGGVYTEVHEHPEKGFGIKRAAEAPFWGGCFDDTMLMSACLFSGMHNHKLDDLSKRYLNWELTPYKEATKGLARGQDFRHVPIPTAATYAAEDAVATLRLWQHFSEALSADSLAKVKALYENTERPLLPVLAAMECAGVAIDVPVLGKLSADFATQMAALEKEIFAETGCEFNINSPKQLSEVFFGKGEGQLGLQLKGKAPTSTNVMVMEALAEAGHRVCRLVLDYRGLSKLRSTYTEALQQRMNTATQRVHTDYHQYGASTGRFSSSDPNLQNIPIRTENGQKIRAAFIAPEGRTLIAADYSQIELRLLAHFSQSPQLLAAYRDGRDIHTETAMLLFGEEKASDMRRVAKIINFGIVYGMGAQALSRQAEITKQEAADFIAKYFEAYDGVKAYMESNKQHCCDHGFVETLLGRRVHLPDIASKNPGFRAGAERAAINAPLQGSNADIIKKVMPEVVHALQEANLDCQLLLQVHDELVFECAHDDAEAAMATILKTMESTVTLDVPLKVEANSATNWRAAH